MTRGRDENLLVLPLQNQAQESAHVRHFAHRLARELDIPLHFLKAGSYTTEFWSDVPETEENPNLLVKERRRVTP